LQREKKAEWKAQAKGREKKAAGQKAKRTGNIEPAYTPLNGAPSSPTGRSQEMNSEKGNSPKKTLGRPDIPPKNLTGGIKGRDPDARGPGPWLPKGAERDRRGGGRSQVLVRKKPKTWGGGGGLHGPRGRGWSTIITCPRPRQRKRSRQSSRNQEASKENGRIQPNDKILPSLLRRI